MLELRPSLKALKGLAIPSISITIFLLFIVADLELVWNIISGNTYLSYVIRLVMLGVEIYLFGYFYLIELNVIEKERQLENNKKLSESLEAIEEVEEIKNLVSNIRTSYIENYINELKSYNNVSVDFIVDSNNKRWYKFTTVK